VAGLEHEARLEARTSDAEYDAREAYELDDPKHPDHYEHLVDIWDNRDKAAGL